MTWLRGSRRTLSLSRAMPMPRRWPTVKWMMPVWRRARGRRHGRVAGLGCAGRSFSPRRRSKSHFARSRLSWLSACWRREIERAPLRASRPAHAAQREAQEIELRAGVSNKAKLWSLPGRLRLTAPRRAGFSRHNARRKRVGARSRAVSAVAELDALIARTHGSGFARKIGSANPPSPLAERSRNRAHNWNADASATRRARGIPGGSARALPATAAPWS